MMLQIAILCVMGALLTVTIRHSVPDLGLVLTIAVTALATALFLEPLKDVLDFLKELTVYSGLPDELFIPLYKVIGIALVVKVSSSLCQDAKEITLAVVIEIAGSICAILSALPLMKAVFSLMQELV